MLLQVPLLGGCPRQQNLGLLQQLRLLLERPLQLVVLLSLVPSSLFPFAAPRTVGTRKQLHLDLQCRNAVQRFRVALLQLLVVLFQPIVAFLRGRSRFGAIPGGSGGAAAAGSSVAKLLILDLELFDDPPKGDYGLLEFGAVVGNFAAAGCRPGTSSALYIDCLGVGGRRGGFGQLVLQDLDVAVKMKKFVLFFI